MAEPCAHVPCTCGVPDEARYCSDHCHQAATASPSPDSCRCGHADCETGEALAEALGED